MEENMSESMSKQDDVMDMDDVPCEELTSCAISKPEHYAKNADDVYKELDRIFFENVVEYKKHPSKLIAKLSDRYKHEYKWWKPLHLTHVEQDDLVRMRGMFLNGGQMDFSAGATEIEEEDGSKRTICALLRNNVPWDFECRNMIDRKTFIFVPERGCTDWYSKTFDGKNLHPSGDVLLKNDTTRIFARFYDMQDENFGRPNLVYDLYGIIDFNNDIYVIDEEDEFSSTVKSVVASLHVIHCEPVNYYDTVAAVNPSILKCNIVDGISNVIHAFEKLFNSKVAAELLVCQLLTSRHTRPYGSIEFTLPYTLENVHDSKPIIELIKLFIPKVHVIDLVEAMLEEKWASYDNVDGTFDQGLLQVSENTLVIIDETKISYTMPHNNKQLQERHELIADFLNTKKIPFVCAFQTVKLDANITVLVLSGEKCFLGLKGFTMVAPKIDDKAMDIVEYYANESEDIMNLCRHPFLSCRENVGQINISDDFKEKAIASFVEAQKNYPNVVWNTARLHRQLTFAKLVAAMRDKKTADVDCLRKAIELNNALKVTVGRPMY